MKCNLIIEAQPQYYLFDEKTSIGNTSTNIDLHQVGKRVISRVTHRWLKIGGSHYAQLLHSRRLKSKFKHLITVSWAFNNTKKEERRRISFLLVSICLLLTYVKVDAVTRIYREQVCA